MKFDDFVKIMSLPRVERYVKSTGGDKRKSIVLYRLNLRLTQELFTVLSCFEVALRNAIDYHYSKQIGPDWLRDSAQQGGMFDNKLCGKTPFIILEGLKKIPNYTHPKLVAEMDFGFWRYMFARHQFHSGGQTLLAIFPMKPQSTPNKNYHNKYVFGELEKLNNLRNRLAHHEPVCFGAGTQIVDTNFARDNYVLILQFFQWMEVDSKSVLYGLDHITEICDRIDQL